MSPSVWLWQRKLFNTGKSSSMLVSDFLCFHEALNVLITLHAMLNLHVILIPCTYRDCLFSLVTQAWRPSHLWPAAPLWALSPSNSSTIMFSCHPYTSGLQQPSPLMPTIASPLGSQNSCLLPNPKPQICLDISPRFTLCKCPLELSLQSSPEPQAKVLKS